MWRPKTKAILTFMNVVVVIWRKSISNVHTSVKLRFVILPCYQLCSLARHLYTLLQMILHNSDIISSVSIYQIQCCKKSEYLHFTDWAHKEERGEECVFYSIDTNVRRQKKFFSVTESKKFSHHFLNKSGSCNWQSFVIILPWDKVIKVATACGTHWEED